jgi:flavodoxin
MMVALKKMMTNYLYQNFHLVLKCLVAELIAEQNKGNLFKIETVNPYPESYDECTQVAQREKNEKARPEIKGQVDNMKDYDVVFLGYPNWWGDMPMAVYTFLESYDFSDKTIIPFCTNEGSGLSNTKQNIAAACPKAKVLEGLSIRGTTAQKSRDEAKKAVTDWLGKINID